MILKMSDSILLAFTDNETMSMIEATMELDVKRKIS